ncbi:MAG TPA: MBL fold metallo-hydrolase [Chitinophagaceae bacterium]|nr:MBL fold metallo-hydrolase [Chitinophagaceae bacterium]
MSLQIASLNSGSNANCYYIGNGNEAILIDAGLSCRETEKRMKRLGLDMSLVKAIFISHEHCDHIAGVRVLTKKYRLPVYITNNTLRNCGFEIEKELVFSFIHSEPVSIGELSIIPFIKSHDAHDPHSFIVSGNAIHIGVITDIGYACKHVIKHFRLCDAVFLESNYCEQMLSDGPYPLSLKKRISSRKGHLSNNQALELFLNHKPQNLQLLILSHLSQNNNHPDIVDKMFRAHAGGVKVVIASRYRETELFSIERGHIVKSLKRLKKIKENKAQLSLFDY